MYNIIILVIDGLKEEAFQRFFKQGVVYYCSGRNDIFLALEYYFEAISFDVSDWI